MTSGDHRIRVRSVATGDASHGIRSEAVLRLVRGPRVAVASAGVAPTPIEPMTRRVPADAGVEHHWAVSEPIETSRGREVDDVITRCDDARAVGPVVRGAHQSRHWGGPDPSGTRGEDAPRLASDERALTDLAEPVGHFFTIAERQDPLASA